MEQEIALRRYSVRLLALIAGVFAVASLSLGAVFGLYPVMPMEQVSIALGVNASVPLLLAASLFVISQMRHYSLREIRRVWKYDAVVMLLMVAVFYLHFLFKCWVPLINTHHYDALFYRWDMAFPSVLDAVFWLRRHTVGLFENNGWAYQGIHSAMITVAYALLARHSTRSYLVFMLALALCLAVGAFLYLPMPSVGPFLFTDGMNAEVAAIQHNMLDWRNGLLNNEPKQAGPLIAYMFTGALAAMPSLHLAIAMIIVLATRSLPLAARFCFVLNFVFLSIESIALRWHYLVDLPVGMAFGAGCYAVAVWLMRRFPEDKEA